MPNMSSSKDKLEDVTLGAFAYAPQSELVDHAVRFLSSWAGSEYVWSSTIRRTENEPDDCHLVKLSWWG